MITLFDLAAAVTYRNAFAHPVDIVRLLPASSPAVPDIRHRTRPVLSGRPGPSVLIQAHGLDSTNFGFDQRENSLLVRIGSVTWTVRDLQAYTSMNSAFTKAHTLAQVIMPPTTPRR